MMNSARRMTSNMLTMQHHTSDHDDAQAALQVLHAHGLRDSALQTITELSYTRLVVAVGISKATEWQTIQAFIKMSNSDGFCNTEVNDIESLRANADNKLLQKVLNSNSILYIKSRFTTTSPAHSHCTPEI